MNTGVFWGMWVCEKARKMLECWGDSQARRSQGPFIFPKSESSLGGTKGVGGNEAVESTSP